MVLLPVVERELRVAARGQAMYRVRFWAVTAMLFVLAWGLLLVADQRNVSEQGEEILVYLTICSFVFSVIIGVVATSDAVSREKREGTLGLLFLTDLKGYDVICGKMAANSVNALYALVATMPVMAIPLLMGGITFAQFVKISLALAVTMFLSLSVGIFVSTYSRNERKSMVFTFLILSLMVFGPYLFTGWCAERQWLAVSDLWITLMFSPGFGIIQTLARGTGWMGDSYWCSVGLQTAIAFALLAMACAHVPQSWEEGAQKKRRRFRPSREKARLSSRTTRGRSWLETNPILWLTMQSEEASGGRVWLFVGAMLAIYIIGELKFGMRDGADPFLIWVEMFFLNTPLKLWIAAEAARFFSESRNNNALELILSTPLPESEIIKGQWRALREQFLGPLALVFAWEICVTLYNVAHSHRWQGDGSLADWPPILQMAADGFTLAVVGMRFGLRFKGRIRALLASLTLVLVAPTAVSLFCVITTQDDKSWTMFAMLRVFVVDPILVIWAGASLASDLRELAEPKG